MIGRRLEDRTASEILPPNARPGDYWRWRRKRSQPWHWYVLVPSGDIGGLRQHQVTEHEDGTITVSPSILVRGGPGMSEERWHGFLERGVWRSV